MTTTHIDARMPAVDQCVLRPLLERRARETPDKIYAIFVNGPTWTYRDAGETARRTANALRALGVKQGDIVLSWLPNGPDAIRLWFGLNYLGAVYTPINTAYKGRLLEHAIESSKARLIVAHAQLFERLADVKHGKLEALVVLAGEAGPIGNLAVHGASALDSENSELPALETEIMPWDTQSIIFTSGTTGPSKAVLSSYNHLYHMATGPYFVGPDDRFMLNLPMFHVGGTLVTDAMLIHGGSMVVVERFDTNAFWPVVREHGITTTILVGTMASFLMKQPPAPNERDHPLRTATIVPLNEAAMEFGKRFGVDYYTHFNMSEVSMPIASEKNPTLLSVAGKTRPGYQLRIVDDNDCEVPPGVVGELLVRSDCPWALNHGYFMNPEGTAKAWRNGWFHTGDALKVDESGNYFFIDRMKDAIRRRGENISSFEVEEELFAHPAVREAAVVAVPSEHGEDEVLAAIALVEGMTLDPEELINFLRPRMALFMVPRYVWILPELPKTPTQKIQKNILRSEAMKNNPWDRERAGVRLRAESFTKAS
jgi:carnitine-CoA ligase